MSSGFAPLRSFVERVERIQSEIDDLNTDKKEIYAEAKGTGFCVKTMKLLIAERRKEPQALAEQSEMLDLYRAAMSGMDVALTHTPAPARATHDPDTGEIAETIHMAGLAAGLTKLAMDGNADAQAVIAAAKSGPEVMKATATAILERDAAPIDDDDLYQRAVTIVVEAQKASASYVQRLLSLGYNKAASLIERMEADGIVSRADVGGRRTVLVASTEQNPKPGAGVESMGNGGQAEPAETMPEPNLGYAAGRTAEEDIVSPEGGRPSPLPAQVHRTVSGGPLKPAIDPDDLEAVTRARQVAMPDIPSQFRRAPVQGNA